MTPVLLYCDFVRVYFNQRWPNTSCYVAVVLEGYHGLASAISPNFWEEKQSVSTAHTKDKQKETERLREKESKQDTESGSLKLGQRQNEQS